MKIEKVSENQIRCTLTKEDLADRQLKISELAYGTENAKALFREMMQQAAYEFGFEAEDIPLMIEAIPMSADSIILIVTKVEYPEELDTRFSKFSDPEYEDDFDAYNTDPAISALPEGADHILDMFRKIQNEKSAANTDTTNQSDDFIPLHEAIAQKQKQEEKKSVEVLVNLSKLFVFNRLDEVSRLAYVLKDYYREQNTLYKNPATGKFYLILTKGQHTPEEFNKVCNILTEYSRQERYTPASEAYFNEHYQVILEGSALQSLSALS